MNAISTSTILLHRILGVATWFASGDHVGIKCKNVWVWKNANLSCRFYMARDVCDVFPGITDFLSAS